MDKATLIAAIKKLTPEEAKDVKKALGVDEQTRKDDYSSMSREQLEHAKQLNKHLAETASLLNQHTEAVEHQQDFLEKQILLMENIGISLEDRNQIMKEIRETGDSELLAHTSVTDELSEQLEKYKQISSTQRGLDKFGSNQKSVTKEIASNIGLRINYNDTLIGQSAKLIKNLNAEGQAGIDAKNAMIAVFKETFNFTNLATNIFTKIKDNSVELFNNFDKAQASLAAATGQGQEFNDVLYEVGRSTNLYGISMDEAGKAIGVLVNQTSYFTSLNKATQMEVAKTTAQMERLGVSTADSAAIFQNFNQGLGMTANESIKMQRDLAMAGVDVGISAEKITKDFNASLGTLMVYGRESINVFKGIAAAAKAAGVETSTLLGIASKFDTFAGAAEGAGKLNALLGTQLSTTEMLMATEDERIRMLVESVQAQGVAFQDMDRFTQKAIANSVGITDMAEANRIFGMSLKEYDENERKLKASADAQKKFEDAVSATVPVMNQFKLLGAEIVVTLQPFFEIMNKGAKELTEFFKGLDTETKELIGTFGAFVSGLILLWPILKAGGWLFSGFKTLGGLMKGTSVVAGPASKGIDVMGKSAGRAAPGVGRLGLAMIELGLGVASVVLPVAALAAAIALMYEGMSKLVDSISGPAMEIFRTMFGTDKEIKEMETRAAEAMARIVSGKPEVALASIKEMVAEVNKMGSTPEVRSTIENLALVTAGQAKDMSGNVISASTTNVTTKVENVFSGMKMTLVVDGRHIDGYVDGLASG